MAILPGITSDSQVLGNTVGVLKNLRVALEAAADLYGWTSGHSAADLVTLGMDPATASALLSAIADANALWQIYNTGQAPGTYPQVTSTPYPYGASQRAVIGPQ